MWLAVWPGVVTASSVQPSPLTTSPSASARSGLKSVSLEDSSRGPSPTWSARAGAVRAFGQHQRAGRGLDRRHAGRMIAMGVGDEDMRHGLAAHRVEQRRAVGGIVGTGIDDRDLAAADDVAHRALEGERARVVAQDAPHAGHRLVDLVRARARSSCRRECLRPCGFPGPCGLCLASLASAHAKHALTPRQFRHHSGAAPPRPLPETVPRLSPLRPIVECCGRGPCVTHPLHLRLRPRCWPSCCWRRDRAGATAIADTEFLTRARR